MYRNRYWTHLYFVEASKLTLTDIGPLLSSSSVTALEINIKRLDFDKFQVADSTVACGNKTGSIMATVHFHKTRDGDKRSYRYNTSVKIAKLGRRARACETTAVSSNFVDKTVSSRAQKNTKAFLTKVSRLRSGKRAIDRNRYCAPSNQILRNFFMQNMRSTSLFVWAQSLEQCRHLRRHLDTKEDQEFLNRVLKAFSYLQSDHVIELLSHDIGVLLVEKLVEVGSKDQRLAILKVVTRKRGQLISISCTPTGNGLVEKMIALFGCSSAYKKILFDSLKQDVLRLATNRKGQSVVYCCLRIFRPSDCHFIYKTISTHLMKVIRRNTSSDGFGGVILIMNCLKVAPENYQRLLVEQIINNALTLSTDSVGHYLVLDILNSSRWLGASREIVEKLRGSFAYLSMQNFSSKVVEACVILSSTSDNGVSMDWIVRELIERLKLRDILQNSHCQTVLQSTRSLCKGALLEELNEAIKL